jgi:hypothetical protein
VKENGDKGGGRRGEKAWRRCVARRYCDLGIAKKIAEERRTNTNKKQSNKLSRSKRTEPQTKRRTINADEITIIRRTAGVGTQNHVQQERELEVKVKRSEFERIVSRARRERGEAQEAPKIRSTK